MLARLKGLLPFQTPEAQRLAVLFAIVYFSQGMWYLPIQTITVVLKDRGLSAGQVADFFAITIIPWLIKPAYGLLSDFLPLFGYRRKSYLLLTSAAAGLAGLALGLTGEHSYWRMAYLFTLMAVGLAFTDVLVDALMVENGKPLGLTGAFQSVQWAAITTATVIVGVLGGYLAEHRLLPLAFFLGACFPLISMLMAIFVVRGAPAPGARREFWTTWASIRVALRERDVWVVGGFLFFYTFSPSFGPALLFYQTDVLHFSQQFIGHLGAFGAVAAIGVAFIYAPLSRRVPLRRLINLSIGIAVAGTLAYLLYRDMWSALAIDIVFGCIGMITQLAFLDLAAKSCPRHVEATFFALLMSIYNAGTPATPTAAVGGEPVKAWLVRPWTPLTEGLPSVIVAKTTIVIGQAFFLVVGLVATHAALPSDSLVVRAMQWLLVVQVLAVGAFVAAQAGGALGGGTRWLQKLGWLSGSPGQTLVQVNDELAHFYRREPARLTLSIFFHFCAWLIGALEPWLILRWIGLPVSLAQATAIEAFSTGIRFAAFLVPGYVGALEAGHVVIFSALGLGAPAGLSFTLIRRVRELAWTGLGFLALAPLKAQAPPTAGRS